MLNNTEAPGTSLPSLARPNFTLWVSALFARQMSPNVETPFRQSSDVTDDMVKRDSGNTLYEQVRDNALAVSGLLVKTIGGPSVYPCQSEGLWVLGVPPYRYPRSEELSRDEQHRHANPKFHPG